VCQRVAAEKRISRIKASADWGCTPLLAFLPEALNRSAQMTDVLGAAGITAKVGFMAF
jgi:hypothetical protein